MAIKKLNIIAPHTTELAADGKVWFEYALMYQVEGHGVQFIKNDNALVMSYALFLEEMREITIKYLGLQIKDVESVTFLAPRIHK